MPPILALALKDLHLALRSPFLVGMTLLAPLGISAIIALSFGATEPESFDPVTVAVVADDDAPLLSMLEGVGEVLDIHRADSEAAARQQLRDEHVELAILVDPDQPPRLVHDPIATVRPRIAEAVVERMLDVELGAALLPPEERPAYYQWVASSPTSLELTSPRPEQSGGLVQRLKARVILAQLVFFAFFAAGFGAQTLLREEEAGTFPRLRTLPLSLTTLLAGKALFLATLVVLQATAFLLAAHLGFGVQLGSLAGVALAVLGLVGSSVGLGLFLISLVESSKQTGALLGTGLTVMAMGGGLFTVGFTDLPRALALLALIFPQGLAFRGFHLALSDASLATMLLTTAASLAMGLLLAALGLFRLRRRYAARGGSR